MTKIAAAKTLDPQIVRHRKVLVPTLKCAALRIGGFILPLLIALSLLRPAPASAATKSDCMELGKAILATNDKDEIKNISVRILQNCNSSELSDLVTYYDGLGYHVLALGAANSCVIAHPEDALCWLAKAVQHVHMQQADEAISAYKRYLALDEGSVNHADHQKQVTAIIDRLLRIQRMHKIMGK